MRKTNLRYDDFVHQIDLDQVYAELGWSPLTTTNTEDKGYCLDPWKMHKHGDTTGKLAINRDKKVYNCWVCGGGRLLDLVMAVKNMDFQQATDWLYRFTAALDQSPDEFYAELDKLLSQEKPTEPTLPYFNKQVLSKWNVNHEWFEERGISDDVRSYFNCGYDRNARRYSRDGVYEGEAVVLPHWWHGKLVGWQHRWLDNSRPRWVAKYTNTTDFPREYTLWGFDFAKSQDVQPILVESVASALFLLSNGYPAIATFGSQCTPDQLRHLRVFTKGVILARDNDIAGEEWERKAIEGLTRFIPVFRVPPVEIPGGDAGDLRSEEIPNWLGRTTYAI